MINHNNRNDCFWKLSKTQNDNDIMVEYVVDSHTRVFFNVVNGGVCYVMVFDATFNNISAISWRSVLLVEKNGVPGKNHRPAACHRHNVVSSTHRLSGIRTHCICSCKSNYHTTTTAPLISMLII